MKMVDLTCPSCKAQMFVDLANKRVYCEHCGRVMILEDDQNTQGRSNASEDSGYLFEKGRQRAMREAEAERAQRRERAIQEQGARRRKENSGGNGRKSETLSSLGVLMCLFFFCCCCCGFLGNDNSSNKPTNQKQPAQSSTVTVSAPATATPVPSVWALSPTSLNQFEYKTNPYDKQLVICDYKGKDATVWIAGEYTLDGEVYKVDLDPTFSFGYYSKTKSVIFGEGIQTVPDGCFAGGSLQYIYIPGSAVKSQSVNGIFGSLKDGQQVYYGGTNRDFYEYSETVEEAKIKFIPVYVNSKILPAGRGVEKGTLYDKNAAVTETDVSEESVLEEPANPLN